MALIPLDLRQMRLGDPVPVTIYDRDRNLLLRSGNVVTSTRQLEALADRGAYVEEEQFHAWVRWRAQGPRESAVPGTAAVADGRADRFDRMDLLSAVASLQQRVTNTLRDPTNPEFVTRLDQEVVWLRRLLQRDADGLLLVLMHQSGTEIRNYAALHSLVCAAVCELSSREWPDWEPELRHRLPYVALTMNLSILRLQDELAYQKEELTLHQKAMVRSHGARSARMLDSIGVRDLTWLGAVEAHHEAPPLSDEASLPALRLARVVQRGDIYTATMSPRAHRPALSATHAGRGVFLDERGQPDAAGGALLRHLGLYPPGTCVRMADGELAVVLRRGASQNLPLVASVLKADGGLRSTPRLRATDNDANRIADAVPSGDALVRLNLEQLLSLTAAAA